jgi:tetratricopeptide (TPR) repeat protein
MPSPPDPRESPSTVRAAGGFLAQEEARRQMTAAHIALRRGQTAEAQRVVQEALARNPDDTEALELWGDIQLSLSRFEEAATTFKQVLQHDPARTTAEAKLARATLRKSETQRKESLGITYASENRAFMQRNTRADRGANIGLAVASAILPGLGQIFGGQFVKGGILLAIYAVGCVLLTVAGLKMPLNAAAIIALVVMTADGIYAVVDAARPGNIT